MYTTKNVSVLACRVKEFYKMQQLQSSFYHTSQKPTTDLEKPLPSLSPVLLRCLNASLTSSILWWALVSSVSNELVSFFLALFRILSKAEVLSLPFMSIRMNWNINNIIKFWKGPPLGLSKNDLFDHFWTVPKLLPFKGDAGQKWRKEYLWLSK